MVIHKTKENDRQYKTPGKEGDNKEVYEKMKKKPKNEHKYTVKKL